MSSDDPLRLPGSRAEVTEIQRALKIEAVEKARRSPFWRDKLAGIDTTRLDDPAEWRRIPILDKEMLRALSAEDFYGRFCHGPKAEIAEYWRSGGSTGKPLFYPRSHADIDWGMVGFNRVFASAGAAPGQTAHNSFPLGIHPAGHMMARSGEIMGVGMAWVGAGAAAPSAVQLQLIQMLRPDIWTGMSSYGVHLANLADAEGLDLAAGPVSRIICTAEPLSAAKRAKLERGWGAAVYDSFGMTECTMMAAEGAARDGLRIWTDLAFIEVVDEVTNEPVPPGTPGALIVTALRTNNATPFLRWASGDIVTYHEDGETDDALSLFPMIRHAHRTAGFFKVKGVNINHSEFEDFLFAFAAVNDFQAKAIETDGLDQLRLSLELARGADPARTAETVGMAIKATFELTAEIEVLASGTLAKQFESSVKAPRFVDERQK